MAWKCPECGAMNYPFLGSTGCECCGYDGLVYSISGTDKATELKEYVTDRKREEQGE